MRLCFSANIFVHNFGLSSAPMAEVEVMARRDVSLPIGSMIFVLPLLWQVLISNPTPAPTPPQQKRCP